MGQGHHLCRQLLRQLRVRWMLGQARLLYRPFGSALIIAFTHSFPALREQKLCDYDATCKTGLTMDLECWHAISVIVDNGVMVKIRPLQRRSEHECLSLEAVRCLRSAQTSTVTRVSIKLRGSCKSHQSVPALTLSNMS